MAPPAPALENGGAGSVIRPFPGAPRALLGATRIFITPQLEPIPEGSAGARYRGFSFPIGFPLRILAALIYRDSS